MSGKILLSLVFILIVSAVFVLGDSCGSLLTPLERALVDEANRQATGGTGTAGEGGFDIAAYLASPGPEALGSLEDLATEAERRAELERTINRARERYENEKGADQKTAERIAGRLTKEEVQTAYTKGYITKDEYDRIMEYKTDPELAQIRKRIEEGKTYRLTDEQLKKASEQLMGELTPQQQQQLKDIADARKALDAITNDPAALQKMAEEQPEKLDAYYDLADKINDRKAQRAIIHAKAENYRAWANKYYFWLKPNAFGDLMQKLVNNIFDQDVGYNVLESENEAVRNFFGYAESGYEHAICASIHDRPEQFVQDYPGHYVGGGDLPSMGSILSLLGRRSEYLGSSNGWFPEIRPDGNITYRGYLYKISWTISNPYTDLEYDNMEDYEREDKGLQANGTIGYSIKVTGTDRYGALTEYILVNSSRLALSATDSMTKSFYNTSKFTKVILQFEKGYEYNNADSKKEVEIIVQNLESNIPPDFTYT